MTGEGGCVARGAGGAAPSPEWPTRRANRSRPAWWARHTPLLLLALSMALLVLAVLTLASAAGPREEPRVEAWRVETAGRVWQAPAATAERAARSAQSLLGTARRADLA